MGLVYVPTWMVDFYGKLVGKYTSPMDPMGYGTFGGDWNFISSSEPFYGWLIGIPSCAGTTELKSRKNPLKQNRKFSKTTCSAIIFLNYPAALENGLE